MQLDGSILGVYLGLSSIPEEWVEKLVLSGVIMRIVDELKIIIK